MQSVLLPEKTDWWGRQGMQVAKNDMSFALKDLVWQEEAKKDQLQVLHTNSVFLDRTKIVLNGSDRDAQS